MKSNYDVAVNVLGLPNFMTSFKEVAENPIEEIKLKEDDQACDIEDLLKFGRLTDEQLQGLHSDLSDDKGSTNQYTHNNDEIPSISVADINSDLPKIKSVAEEILGADNGKTWAEEQGRKLTTSLKETFLPIIIKAYNFAKNLAA